MMIIRHHENPLMAQTIQFGQCIETAGQVADDLSLNLQGQTQNILQKIDLLLTACGANKNHLVRIQIWMKDITYFQEMNEIYSRWLENHPKPVRACVESRLADDRYLIEIQAFAYIPSA